ncbi:MAG: hypothetical protein ACP5I6_06860 [Caldisphaera sp.]|nr:hypothetical protein [Caldisphaera sp.]
MNKDVHIYRTMKMIDHKIMNSLEETLLFKAGGGQSFEYNRRVYFFFKEI